MGKRQVKQRIFFLFLTSFLAGQPALRADEAPPTPSTPPTPEAAAETGERFDIWEFQVEGNTLLPGKDIERTVYPYLGPDKSIKDVETAREQLEMRYRDEGYGTALVDIPEQDVVGGVVRLQVTEGKVSRLKVTGSRYFSLGRIKQQVPALAEDQVPHLPKVQEQLNALNRASNDRQITPVLRPGKTPGTLEADLQVQDEFPLHGELALNDRFTRDTTRTRLNASLRYDNLWQMEHSLAVNYQVSPQDPAEVQVFSGTYVMPIPDSDKILTFYGVVSESDVAAVGAISVIGQGAIAGVRGTIPLPAQDNYFHNLTWGGDYKDFDESIVLQGADSQNTPIDYLSFLSEYSGTWQGDKSTTNFSVGAHFAFRGLGNSETEFGGERIGQDPLTGADIIEGGKRLGSRPNFFYLTVHGEHLREWFWGTSLFTRFDGQWTDAPLISNEQISGGGADSVRGYLESEVLADDGFTATLELRSPSFAKIWDGLQNLQISTFVDGGRLRLQDPLLSQISDFSMLSAGFGIELLAWRNLAASLFWAWPLEAAGTARPGESRLHFQLGYAF
jgi:hemolysin activation/secretion protein